MVTLHVTPSAVEHARYAQLYFYDREDLLQTHIDSSDSLLGFESQLQHLQIPVKFLLPSPLQISNIAKYGRLLVRL